MKHAAAIRILSQHVDIGAGNLKAHQTAPPYPGYLDELEVHIFELTDSICALSEYPHLKAIDKALDDYHEALRDRQHGDVAVTKFIAAVERIFGRNVGGPLVPSDASRNAQISGGTPSAEYDCCARD